MTADRTRKTILITGATGQQGGAVARHLSGKGFNLRAMTRHPESERARELADAGFDIVKADLASPASVRKALEGVWGLFSVQNVMDNGPDLEEEQGKRLATLARERGVQHIVYTSVSSAQDRTGIPHFESKWRIEERIRSLGFPSCVIIRPVFFMENLTAPWCLTGDSLALAMNGDKPLQMIAVDDIGRFGALAFERSEELNGSEIDLAGDEVSLREAAALLSAATGRRIAFKPLPIEEVRKHNADFATMFEWFDRTGYRVDIPALHQRYGIACSTLAAWVHKVKVMV